MTEKVLAATLVGPERIELREYAMPGIGPDDGLLRVERCGVCGSDVHDWRSMDRGVRILGHENIGHIAGIGHGAARRWGVREGDRVALEEYVPCGACEACRSGDYRFCPQTDIGLPGERLWYGSTPVTRPPSLWGGYAQYLYMHPGAIVHKLPDNIPADEASFFLPYANGFEWVLGYGGAGPGKAVVVQGPGQQGLACLLAAKGAGASPIIVSGLTRDAARLDIARRLGADATVDVERESLPERVMAMTSGHGADVVINTAGAPGTIAEGIAAAARHGIMVLGALGDDHIPVKGTGRNNLTLKWAHGHSYRSVELAIQSIGSGRHAIGLITTHHFGLPEAETAIRSVAGQGAPGALHVSIDPWT